MKPIVRQILSKSLLMKLPTGLYLVSNAWTGHPNNDGKPLFAEEVIRLEERGQQWQRIRV